MTAGKVTAKSSRVIGERYQLIASIGSGASAEVFQAKDLRLNRNVALKQLRPGLTGDSRFIKLFRSEAQIVAQLSHRNILTVFDWSDDPDDFDGGAYIVSEFLNGGTLKELLAREKTLTVPQVCDIGLQAANGIAAAHKKGLVHRDIKPGNLLFDTDGRLAVGDFGIARAVAEAAWTEPEGVLIGTARYAAPEQATDTSVSDLVDIYSLSLCMVEALKGEVPLVKESALGTMMGRQKENIPVDETMGVLAEPLAWGGAADPTERATAKEFVEALEAVSSSLPKPQPLALIDLTDSGVGVAGLGRLPKRSNKSKRPAKPKVEANEIDVMAEVEKAGPPKRDPGYELVEESLWNQSNTSGQGAKGDFGRGVRLHGTGKEESGEAEIFDFEADSDSAEAEEAAFDPAGEIANVNLNDDPEQDASESDANVRFDSEGGLLIGSGDDSVLSIPAAEPADHETDFDSEIIGEIDGHGPDESAEFADLQAGRFLDLAGGDQDDSGIDDTDIDGDPEDSEHFAVANDDDGELSTAAGRDSAGGWLGRGLVGLLSLCLLCLVGFGFWRFVVVEGSLVEVELGLPVMVVPEFVGASEGELAGLAEAGGFVVEAESVRFDGSVVGEVISQDPAVGEGLPFGGVVSVKVSEGQALRVVPNVVLLSEAEARDVLVDGGLVVGVVSERADEDVTVGQVLEAQVGGVVVDVEDSFETGTRVDLVLSGGPAPRVVPDVVGDGVSAASEAVAAAGLDPVVVEVFSSSVAKGLVVSTSPAAGKSAARGGEIEVRVSKGIEFVKIPDVFNLSEEEAADELEALGFKIGDTDGPANGRVVGTEPRQGTTVAKGTLIVLETTNG